MAMELAELVAEVLGWFNPKRTIGKIIWGVVFAVFVVIAVIEILGALGY